jgi:NTP pyrophosphatase (non-canonical NTP hydrolase)
MFKAQEALISKYVELGRMPKFPVQLSSREGQKVMKELGGYLIEELSEMHEEYLKLYLCVDLNMQSEVSGTFDDFKEEMADCLHFVFEILIYAGISYEGLLNLINSYSPLESSLNMETTEFDWSSLFNWANRYNANEVPPIEKTTLYKISTDKGFWPMGISPQTIEIQCQFLWNITHWSKKADMYLKNKPWKATQQPIDVLAYEQTLFQLFLMFIRTAQYFGFTAEMLFGYYMRKNEKNLERIKNNY